MIAVDTNLLVYAHREDSEWHAAAKTCLVELATSGSPWAIAWSSLHEFVAVVTHPRIYSPPAPQAMAFPSSGQPIAISRCSRTSGRGIR
jgi:predicted nucleic acid-binding protein